MIQPMLLQKRPEPFDDPQFIFEPKIDGHRLLLTLRSGQTRLYTRHDTDCTRQYPELLHAPISDLDVVLDGEVAYVDPETGMVDFDTIMSRFHASNPAAAARQHPAHYFVFDVLQIGDEDMRSKPLMQRKEALDALFSNSAYISKVIHSDGQGIPLFNIIQQRKLEGIVAKKKNSAYVPRRSPNWLKIINYTEAVVDIAGYRKNEFGWLAQIDGRYIGVIELAVPAAHRSAFYRVASQLKTKEDRKNVYIEPRIKARVRFRNWTRRGLLRSPEFVEFIV